MQGKENVYITGHRHPDTDSIASAVAYAFFKKAMGIHATACRLGPMNPESRYLLERFNIEPPMLLDDARAKVSEIDMDPPTYIKPDTTIFETLSLMEKGNHTYCGVVDDEMHLVGFITKSDIAEIGLGDTASNIDIMSRVSAENIVKTIDGKLIYKPDEMHLNGNVSIIAMTDMANLDNYEIRDRIVIVGNDPASQKKIIEKGAGMLIAVWTPEISSDVLESAKACGCTVILSGHGVMNTSRYLYFAPPVKLLMRTKLVKFSVNELAEDVGEKMMKTRYHMYPVVDLEGKLAGYISRYYIMNAKNKKIIMVDHNEFSQSVRGAHKARILEVIDHHRINDFSSMQPVAFRNEIVGSTATIIATIYRENQIPVPKNIAGLLLGALLSDTMDFHSPTTTDKDRETANILAAMADLDIETFAKELFKVSADNEGRTLSDMINQDVKFYDIDGCKAAISQIIVNSAVEMGRSPAAIQPAIDRFAEKKALDLAVVVFTSIIENGSVVYSAGRRSGWAVEAFEEGESEEHSFHDGMMSRKQQILPELTKVIEKYG